MRDRCIHRLKLQITGDRTKPKLFRVIRDLLVSAIESLLERTHETLENAVNQCCVDIGIDLGLLRGEEVPALGEEGIIATVFDILDQSKARVDVAEREFESGVVTR